MELKYFFSVLSKRKWLLLTVMLLTAATTWFVVEGLPKKYKATAVITTGITEYKGVRVDVQNVFVQEFEVDNKFANLTAYMKSVPSINALTKRLMLHDLKPDSSETPFHTVDISKLNISKEQIENYITALVNNPDSIGISDKDIQNLTTARALEKAFGYDYETLSSKIELKRVEKSDYVRIEYSSENPKLTYFVTKNFVDEFLNFFYKKKGNYENRSVAFYDDLTGKKKSILDSLNNALDNYSRKNNVVALKEQSQMIVSQIKELEAARDEEQKKLVGYRKSYDVYSAQFGKQKEALIGVYSGTISNNSELQSLQNQMETLRNKWVDSGMKDDGLKKKIEELQGKRVLVSQKVASSLRDQNDPYLQRQNELYLKYVEVLSNKDASEQAVGSLNSRIGQLQNQKSSLVKNNADVARYTQQIDISQKEYENAVAGQSQASVIKQSSGSEDPMRIIETPLPPTKAENNKSRLLATFAGVGMGTLATVLLFLLTYFDRTLSSTFQFAKLIGLPLLGVLNKLNARKFINFDNLFADVSNNKEGEYFKESIRKIRHDIEVSGAKSFLFASLKEQEGKSFVTASLAYTLSMKNKKVLIIDTNFKNNTLSGLSVKPFSDNLVAADDAQNAMNATKLSLDINLPTVAIIGNKGGHNSPSELLSGIDFKKKIEDFGKQYDYIFLEAACLNKYSDARELVDYVEKVIPIFDATTSYSPTDDNGINFFKGLGNKMMGGILNKVETKSVI